ncbi:MAG: TMEM14 family protein [Cyanobacteria bacterium J06635_15]
MSLGVLAAIAYGLLAIVGGIIGFAQASSKVSLISGLVSGLLLLVGALLASQGNPAGVILSLVVTALLIVVFIIRLIKTRKAMPAALMIVAGLAALVPMVMTANRV